MERERNYPKDTEGRDISDEVASTEGIDRTKDNQPEKFHEEHGNRKYKMFRNHSSADDQPMTDTGPSV